MTQQTKWGPEIAVNGKRPEWLGIGLCKAFIDDTGCFGGWTEDYEDQFESDPADWKWVKEDGSPRITRIRLPADHPHYAQPDAPTPSPELTARMVEIPADQAELLRRVLTSIGACVGTTLGGKSVFVPEDLVVEARKAAALFPERPDPDTSEAERIAYDMEGALPRDLVEAGIKAGRALAEAGK